MASGFEELEDRQGYSRVGEPLAVAERPADLDGVGPVRLELAASTAYPSGVLWLRYRPADQQGTPSGA